jgi:SlyX protein
MEERLVELETKITFQDQTIEELSGVIASQQTQINLVIEELRRIRELLPEGVSTVVPAEEEKPPPHY